MSKQIVESSVWHYSGCHGSCIYGPEIVFLVTLATSSHTTHMDRNKLQVSQLFLFSVSVQGYLLAKVPTVSN